MIKPISLAAESAPQTKTFSDRFTFRSDSGDLFAMELYFPAFLHKGVLTFIKNLFCGLGLSLLISVGFILFLIFGKDTLRGFPERKSFHRFMWAAFLGFGLIWYRFFYDYQKFSQYLSYFAALGTGIFTQRFLKSEKKQLTLALSVFICGLAFGGYNTWGHGGKDPYFRNFKFLWPNYGAPLDRISRKANRPTKDLSQELQEYSRALQETQENHGEILFMDHEPGALIPSLLGKQFLGDVLYLENLRSSKVYNSTTLRELSENLQALKIAFIYRPGRSHGVFEKTLIMQLARAYLNTHSNAFLIPALELTKSPVQ